jgi:hypothetical protein
MDPTGKRCQSHLKEGTRFGILRVVSASRNKPHVLVLTNHGSAAYENHAIASAPPPYGTRRATSTVCQKSTEKLQRATANLRASSATP